MFSKTAEYALRATIFIAQKGTIEQKLGIDEIAKAIGSPQSFTAKILQMLTKDNKIVSSARGPHGGFYVTRQAKKLPAKVILEAVDEEDVLKKCVLGLKQCSEIKPCPMHAEYKLIRDQLNLLFQNTTIQHLADEMNKEHIFINSTRSRK
ncbi:MAG: Rrf2 family transcriptional regulator [Ginsengibacter sp.]|jgi:Rrf2 family iron-sulfur cluster assembly transcriptional regulator